MKKDAAKLIRMDGNKCLLDTSIIVQVFKENSLVKQRLDMIEALLIPLPVVGELLYGANKSDRLQKHLYQTENFLARCSILFPDFKTAEVYGQTKALLAKKGRPIPDNDIWIAAVALQFDLELYTIDAHFREIDGLRLFNPLTSV